MKRQLERARAGVGWLWKHASTGVAIGAIVAALVVGYRIGRPAPEPSDAGAGGGHEHAEGESIEPRMYTCSMHPSVRLPDPDAKCPICFMDLIPVMEQGGADSGSRISISESAAALSDIETAPVGRFFPTAEVRLYGKVTYDETSVARLTAYFPGRIERLFLNYTGVAVARGEHVAEVYSPDLLAAFEELRQAKAASETEGGMSDLVRAATRDTVVAAREKLRLFGITAEQIAAVENGSFDADNLTIFAPIGGVVTHLAVREGDYLQTGAPIATIADLSRLWLDMEAYESQLPLLRWGQRVTFSVEAHPGEIFEGRISFIEPIVDERTRTAAKAARQARTRQSRTRRSPPPPHPSARTGGSEPPRSLRRAPPPARFAAPLPCGRAPHTWQRGLRERRRVHTSRARRTLRAEPLPEARRGNGRRRHNPG